MIRLVEDRVCGQSINSVNSTADKAGGGLGWKTIFCNNWERSAFCLILLFFRTTGCLLQDKSCQTGHNIVMDDNNYK